MDNPPYEFLIQLNKDKIIHKIFYGVTGSNFEMLRYFCAWK